MPVTPASRMNSGGFASSTVRCRCGTEAQIAVERELHDRFRAGVQPVQGEIPCAEIERQPRVVVVAHAPGIAVVDFQQRRAGHIVVKGDGFRTVCLQRQFYAGIQRPDIQPTFVILSDAGAGRRREEQCV